MPLENKPMSHFVKEFVTNVIYPISFCEQTDANSLNFSFVRYANHKPVRARIQMMPIGTPRVPYRTPGEGTWQWVDIWNALVSCYTRNIYLILHLMLLKDAGFSLCCIGIEHM